MTECPDIFAHITQWLDEYIATHVPADMRDHPMIIIKREHSDRVSSLCQNLARELEWSDNDILLAGSAGLLHDAGRFSQVAEHDTFSDAKSFNHGERGFLLLENSDILNVFSPPDRQAVLDAVRYHNSREIPQIVSEESRPLARLVRDADKIDIYSIIIEAIRSETLRDRLIQSLKIDVNGPVNPAAIEEVLNNETVSNKYILSRADFHLMQLSWVFDINFQPSFRHILETSAFTIIAGELPDDPAVNKAVDHVMNVLSDKATPIAM